ncbi:hypothetical protein [Lysobacter sp. GCM10012299]|uniref:hypothetical protein n=1 Tax=Lysobacter sp. GCM10012299 TaxID=3317333 RepID=UPI00362170F6
MKKPEAERQIRYLIGQWCNKEEHRHIHKGDLHFSRFHSWLEENWPSLLQFRSVMPVRDEVERWFDQETGQTWRN